MEEFMEVRMDIQEVLNETESEIERIKSKIEVLHEEKEIKINEVSHVPTLCFDLADQYE